MNAERCFSTDIITFSPTSVVTRMMPLGNEMSFRHCMSNQAVRDSMKNDAAKDAMKGDALQSN